MRNFISFSSRHSILAVKSAIHNIKSYYKTQLYSSLKGIDILTIREQKHSELYRTYLSNPLRNLCFSLLCGQRKCYSGQHVTRPG